jgi:hyperosmotically inducible protein
MVYTHSGALRVLATAAMLWGGAALLPAQETKPAPDNTKVNERDRSKEEPTADKAKDNKSDRELMQQIRKAIVDDKSLSTYAHNVKVIARNGKITLKGPVQSAEEKSAIVSKATDVAGAGNVTDELTVKAQKSDRKKKDSKES